MSVKPLISSVELTVGDVGHPFESVEDILEEDLPEMGYATPSMTVPIDERPVYLPPHFTIGYPFDTHLLLEGDDVLDGLVFQCTHVLHAAFLLLQSLTLPEKGGWAKE